MLLRNNGKYHWPHGIYDRPCLLQTAIIRGSDEVLLAVLSLDYHRLWLICNNAGCSFKEMPSAVALTNYHHPGLQHITIVILAPRNYHRLRLQQSIVGCAIYKLTLIVAPT